MHDALSRRATQAAPWLDLTAAAVIGAFCVVELATDPPRATAVMVAAAAAAAVGCAALVMRANHPLVVSLAVGVAFFVPGVLIGPRWWNSLPEVLLLVCVILAYTVGARLDGAPTVIGLIATLFAVSAGDLSDPVSMVVFTIPAWVAGRVMKSRNRLAEQLAVLAQELEHEREAFAREAVRYERARIARDLHDIVAHSVSMIVVQAGAGRRALTSNPGIAVEALRHIEGGAHQAELEVGQLVELLGDDRVRSDGTGLRLLDELVRRAAATGLSVTYRFSGALDDLPAELADAAYHVAQEGITNALKHAPGAPISVTVQARSPDLSITIQNGPPTAPRSGLEHAGGDFGVAGLRDRLLGVGGSLQTGPTAGGGWQLTAQLPRAGGPTST
jgi:signal transduction histidine kinase